ncbi:MAG: hypothetical protein JXR34_06180 [Bacteroidales bacterium]|nr:hypothetical protein [Bacteroidales bacterium]
MNIYAISGLGANTMLFDQIRTFLPMTPLEWLTPEKGESLQDYAKRMAKPINTQEPFCLLGVSFGGLVVAEMNKFISPEKNFLISTVHKHSDLRWIYRIIGKTQFDTLLPEAMYKIPFAILKNFIGAKDIATARKIHNQMDAKHTKWAVGQLIRWQGNLRENNIIKVNGINDLLMPIRSDEITIRVEKGTHFMIVDQAETIAAIIRENL